MVSVDEVFKYGSIVVPGVYIVYQQFGAPARRVRTVDEATKRIAFVEAWREAKAKSAQLSPNDERLMEEELQYAFSEVKRTHVLHERSRDRVGWFRQYLLLYDLATPLARTFRRLAYGYVIFIVFCFVGRLLYHFSNKSWSAVPPHPGQFLILPVLQIVLMVVFGNVVEKQSRR